LLRQHGVALVISADHRRALARLEEIEGGEQRKVGAFVKDQRRLQTAVGQEDAIGKLWKLFAISRHAEFLPAREQAVFIPPGRLSSPRGLAKPSCRSSHREFLMALRGWISAT